MKKFLITEWCPLRGCMVRWRGEFASMADAYSAIEYFGSADEIL